MTTIALSLPAMEARASIFVACGSYPAITGTCCPQLSRHMPDAANSGITVANSTMLSTRLAVGTQCTDDDAQICLTITHAGYLPARLQESDGSHALFGYWLQTTHAIKAGQYTLTPHREGISLAWVTLSDKGAAGEREDRSGPLIESLCREVLPIGFAQGYMIPDSAADLKGLLNNLALIQHHDLIITTGGTGIGPRDITPDVMLSILERRLTGFEQAMMSASLKKTPHAVISRAMAGTLGGTLIINLPGSKKAVAENLEAVLPAIQHTIAKLQGDKADCGA